MVASTRKRILVIDDEEYFRVFLSNLFEKEQIEVVACVYGREALELLARETFDFIVVDYQLPDMLGLEILDYLQERQVSTPRIMVTAYGSIDVAVRALKTGAVDFFTKPLTDPHAFVRFLNRTLSLDKERVGDAEAEKKVSVSVPPATAKEELPRTEMDAEKARDLCARFQPPIQLSRREYEVIGVLLRGLSNKEIGAALYISERTVKNHLTNIYRKFDVDGRSQLFNRILADLA